MPLTKKALDVLRQVAERPETGVTICYVGREVASCRINDPRGMGVVTADEMDELDDWDIPVSAVTALQATGCLVQGADFSTGHIGRLPIRYVCFKLTDVGRSMLVQEGSAHV